jgi:hypothetical protein
MRPFDVDMISTITQLKMNRFNLGEESNYAAFCGAKTAFKRPISINLAPNFTVPGSNLDIEDCCP